MIAVRVSGKNVSAQFIRPRVAGDQVLSSSHSRELRKHGWKGSLKSTPACYLLGLLAGKKAMEKGVHEAYMYNGVTPFVKGSRLSAFAKGVVDSGLKVPVSVEVFPNEDRISGRSIATFAASLASEDKEAYEKRFSVLLKLGLRPEDYAAHHAQVRKAIEGGAS